MLLRTPSACLCLWQLLQSRFPSSTGRRDFSGAVPYRTPRWLGREVRMLLAAHAECLHLAPWFIPAGTPRSATSLWEGSEHRERNTSHTFRCFTSPGTSPDLVTKCALCRIITSPFRCSWIKSLFFFSFEPKISFQNALGYLKRRKEPKTCF